MVKVVLIGPVYPYRGGIAHYTTMLYRAFCEQGYDVLLISFKRQYPAWLFPGQSDKDPSAKPLDVENVHYSLDSLNPITWLTTFLQIRRFQPQMIILSWWTTFWALAWSVLGILNHWLLKRSFVYICHNVLPHEAHWWDRLIARFVLHWGTHFIVQSEAEKARFEHLLPFAQATVFPLPVYDMFAGDKIPKDVARERLSLPKDIPVLLFFGIVREYKGLQILLRALPEVQQHLGDFVLLVAGEFWENRHAYMELIDELGILECVVIDDRYIPNEEVVLYFSAADLLVAPYLHATGSGVVQMARGFQLPAITSLEVGDSGAGILSVPAGDVAALAAAIIAHFADNRELEYREGSFAHSSWESLGTVLGHFAA